jgi:hypothetical protein
MRHEAPFTLIVAALLFAGPTAHAQASLSVAAGAAWPVGGTAESFTLGYNAFAALTIKPPLSTLGLRIDVIFNELQGTAANVTGLRTVAFTANATLSTVASPIPVYAVGGFGLYNSDPTGEPPGVNSGWNNDLGFNVGAGLSLPFTGVGAFIEARLHVISSETESIKFVPLVLGLKF